MKGWIIEKLGGYKDINSAIDAIREKDSKEKFRILTLAVKRLFNTIDSEDILKEDMTGSWTFEGKTLSDAEKKIIVAEAVQFTESTLFKILEKDIKYQINRKMYITAKNNDDLVAGKLWIFTFDAMKTRLKSLKAGKAIFNSN